MKCKLTNHVCDHDFSHSLTIDTESLHEWQSYTAWQIKYSNVSMLLHMMSPRAVLRRMSSHYQTPAPVSLRVMEDECMKSETTDYCNTMTTICSCHQLTSARVQFRCLYNSQTPHLPRKRQKTGAGIIN